MNTTKDTQEYIGKVANWPAPNGLTIFVHILDVKIGYGRTMALIIPEAGNGSTWVNISNLNDIREAI